MLEATQIACVRGSRRLFDGLSFRLEAKQALQVRGDNGSGKTSLLRIMAGLAPAEAGEVCWKGGRIGGLGEDYRREMVFLGHANALKEDLTPVENARHALALADLAAEDEAICAQLHRMGLAAVADLPVRLLSQGQKRRAALARLEFCGSKPLWLLDEPFAALDASAVARLAARLAAHVEGGGMLLFTTHQDVELPGVQVRSLQIGSAA
jgi:heme exporter protein A